MTDLNYKLLPEHMQEGMRRYIEQGAAPGSFLTAILSNNFVEAAVIADTVNQGRLFSYAEFLYHQAPINSWGNPRIVGAWIAKGGINGIQARANKRGDGNEITRIG